MEILAQLQAASEEREEERIVSPQRQRPGPGSRRRVGGGSRTGREADRRLLAEDLPTLPGLRPKRPTSRSSRSRPGQGPRCTACTALLVASWKVPETWKGFPAWSHQLLSNLLCSPSASTRLHDTEMSAFMRHLRIRNAAEL